MNKQFSLPEKRGNAHKSPINKITKVEFIGSSGIGKSALQNEIIKYYHSKKHKLIEDLIPNRSELLELNNSLTYSYELLLEKKQKSLVSSNISIADKYSLNQYYLDIILLDIFLNYIEKDYIVLLHEGVVHNFIDELLSITEQESKFLKELLSNRIFVFCFAQPDLILERIKIRKLERGSLRTFHKNMTDKELLDYIIQTQANIKSFFNKLQILSYPVIEIDMSEILTCNSKKVISFIKSSNLNNSSYD